MYTVLWDEAALTDLRHIDKATARKIIEKVSMYLAKDPKSLGRPLSAQFSGLMRYRFGDYRIIYELNNTDQVITVIKVGHRKEVYD